MATKKQIYNHMKRAMRAIPLTQEHDYIGEFHMATKKQIYKHMKPSVGFSVRLPTMSSGSWSPNAFGALSRNRGEKISYLCDIDFRNKTYIRGGNNYGGNKETNR